MPLASKDGKLYVKTVTEIVDGKEVEVQKLCTSCCGDTPTGRCCVYTGYQVSQGCGETPDEAIAAADLEAEFYENSFIGTPKPTEDELCLWACAVYVYDEQGGNIDCIDTVTEQFCNSKQIDGVISAIFTEGEDCGEVGLGTCPALTRRNPLP